MMKILKVNKSSLKSRTINIPGDKSISHRAIILLSLASNSSTIRGLLEAEDCLHTIRIMQELGVNSNLTGITNLLVTSNYEQPKVIMKKQHFNPI